MNDMATAIMDAAEKHIRTGGFNAFSFRDLAAEVGVKSSSVHYHFATKEKLAAAVVQRYTDRVSEYVDELSAQEHDPVKMITKAFKGTVYSDDRLCPCLVMGAAIFDLPGEVATKVKEYYKMWYRKLEELGVSKEKATFLLSTLLGGQLLAAVEDDVRPFDETAKEVVREYSSAA